MTGESPVDNREYRKQWLVIKVINQQFKLTIDDIGIKLGQTPQFLYAAADNAMSQYALFDLPKKSGGVRTICSPKDDLKRLQRTILEAILWDLKMPPDVHGCVRGRSVATNAEPHIQKPLVISIDLKDFFGSVGFEDVNAIFCDYFLCDDKAADVLTRLTTYGNFLPQGAPTSPTLANIAAIPLDQEIKKICLENASSFDYTRYVDDITISGDNKLALLLGPIYRTIHEHGFRANPNKFKAGRPSQRQKVTGVVVNKKLNPPKKLVRKLRQQLYYCSRFGIEEHCSRQSISPDEFINEINGLLGYVRIMQPGLADKMKIQLSHLELLEAANLLGDEEAKLLLLKFAIEEEKNVTFTYDDKHKRAAPAELYVDDDGARMLRAFQIYPETHWERFNVLAIRSLQVEGFMS